MFAQTVEGLAGAFHMPVDALAMTLEDYNRFARGETEDPLGRQAHARPLQFPLWGVRITGALAHTQGGVRVDATARVIRADGMPIPGLLAAGGTAVGISGHGAAGYSSGNGLAQAFVLGMIAADTVAAQTLDRRRGQALSSVRRPEVEGRRAADPRIDRLYTRGYRAGVGHCCGWRCRTGNLAVLDILQARAAHRQVENREVTAKWC